MKKFAVIGDPIQHSLSPFIHRYYAAQHNIQLSYNKLRIENKALQSFVSNVNYHGINITAPHKETVYQLIANKTPRALAAKSINTLTRLPDQTLIGDTTDGVGLIADLNDKKIILSKKNILLIGAGGAAKAILPNIIQQQPNNIAIINRTADKGKDLAQTYHLSFYHLSEKIPDSWDIIFNAATATDQLPLISWQDCELCYDLNYAATHTAFQQIAIKHQIPYQTGLGMLIEQAAEAFQLWHHLRPETAHLKANFNELMLESALSVL